MDEIHYIKRDVIDVNLEDLCIKEYMHPETIRIKLPHAMKAIPLDVGCLAYSRRKYLQSTIFSDGNPYVVDPSSLIEWRRKFLRTFFEYIVSRGFRESTIRSLISRVRLAFNKIDDLGCLEYLRDPEITKAIYISISIKLKHDVQSNLLLPRTAQGIQGGLSFLIYIRFGRSFSEHVKNSTIKITGKVSPTQPREINDLRIAYDTYKTLALGLTDFLVNKRPFPCLLEFPEYKTHLFPCSNHRVTPYCYRPTDVYNHEEGRMVTENEYFSKRPDKHEPELRNNLKRSIQRLMMDNANCRAKSRRALAATAMQSYQMIFMMLTGAYITELNKIEFDSDMEFKKSITHKSYRTVKFRAAGREIQYDLASGAVSLFKNYLKLREYVLNGKQQKLLFFGLKVKSWETVPVCESSIRAFQRAKMIGIFMPRDFDLITARQVRKTKSLFLHEQPEIDSSVVAEVLNHSTETNQCFYMEVSSEKAIGELDYFWSSAHEAATHIKYKVDENCTNDKKTSVGHCNDYQHPNAISNNPPIVPNCKTMYGCLYCEHYICHANDADDIHKLCSLLYIITGVMNASESKKAKELFIMLSARVRYILHQIKMKSIHGNELVCLYLSRSFKYGELTPYWECRLQRYESLGIVFDIEVNDGEYSKLLQ